MKRTALMSGRLLVIAAFLGGALGLATLAPAPVAADGNEANAAPAVYRQLSAGTNHTCAILYNGSVKCWGENVWGQLGLGDTANRGDGPDEMGDNLPTVDLGTGRTAVAISAGQRDTCAVLDNGSLKCWGQNPAGQLGLGDTVDRGNDPGEMGDNLPAVDLGTGRTAVAVSTGNAFTCALLDNGSVKCWGANNFGQLGSGNTNRLGDQPGEMGDALPAIDLGTGRTAVSVSAGGIGHVCAVLDNGSLKCWGDNNSGELGLGNAAHRGDNPGEMGDALPAVALGTGRTAKAVTTGGNHTCALLDNGSVKCWGFSINGALGIGDTSNHGAAPGQMGDALPVVDLGAGRTAVSISSRGEHSCALLDDGSVRCWGYNVVGQLGLGDTDNRGDQPGEMGAALPAVSLGTGRTPVAVTTGGAQTCVRLDDGGVTCWGLNDKGQLGLGDTNSRGDDPDEMGDSLPVASLVTPAPAMTVVVTSDESSVAVGATIHTHATITNTGNVGLTGLTVPTAGCSSPAAVLLPGANTVVDCTHVATARDVSSYGASVSAGSDQTTAVTSNTVNVSVTIPSGYGLVKGTVTAQLFANAVPGALVAALDKDTFAVKGLDTTATDGTYAMLVPAGSVFLYLADPAGNHIASFHQNTPTAVGDGQTVTLNPQLNRALGGIEGRITDQASGDGVASGLALTVNARTGQLSIGAATDGFGFYVIRNLRSVGYWVALLDLSGGHASRYYDGATTPAGASTVNVVGGALQVIGTSTLPAQTPPGGAARLQGTVTGPGGGALSGVAAIALRAGTFQYVGGDLTDGSGAYDIPVDAGSYVVGFADPAGSHLFEWYADQPSSGLATATPVTATAVVPGTADAELATLAGSVGGTVTEDGSGNPLQDMWVFAIDSTGSVVGVARTAADGTYSIANVPAGGVRVRVMDITGGHTSEYYDNHVGPNAGTDYAGATVVPITGGATSTVNAALALSS